MVSKSLTTTFGNIDIYLFDQLLKGRFDQCRNIIDVGCGAGRNLVYFLRQGYNVHATDRDTNAVEAVKSLAAELAPHLPAANFAVAEGTSIPFPDASFDLVISSAVLHFATGRPHFEAMLQELRRMLAPGGYLFARLTSDIGIESLVKPIGEGRYLLPDGSVRYLVSHQMLEEYTAMLGGELYEPIKTTNVSNLRAMTTWCLRKK